ncbi:MAG: glycosyltransferase family 2 protein [Gammaproteobacteria bacterium]|nr:glycosyltransferase family 2 protein [Gammaproteobacteria bacterium]
MISVLIVNYDTAREVKRAIDSVLRQRDIAFAIYVIDNASQDNSVEVLKAFGEQIHFIASEKNLGFGKANNLLFQQVSTPYIYLMNPDAWLEDDHTLAKFVNYIQRHPDCGMVGSAVMSEDGSELALPNYRYPRQRRLRQPLPPLPGEITWIMGANMVMPAALFRQLNGFDEAFFLYGEDADLCIRVRMAGYIIGLLSDVIVRHVGGASGKNNSVYDRKLKKCVGFYQFCQKHYPPEDVWRIMKCDYTHAKSRAWRYRLAFMLTRRRHYQICYLEKRATVDCLVEKMVEYGYERD